LQINNFNHPINGLEFSLVGSIFSERGAA